MKLLAYLIVVQVLIAMVLVVLALTSNQDVIIQIRTLLAS